MALHRRLSKYLTDQDTCGTHTLTKHNITLARLGYLIYLQPRSTIKVNRFFLSLVLSKLIKKTIYSSDLVTTVFSFSFPKPKLNNYSDRRNNTVQWFSKLIILFYGNKQYTGAFFPDSAIILYLKNPFNVFNLTFNLVLDQLNK